MKAARFHEFGGADKLVVEDVPVPSPEPDQVVVRIAASALNHLDVDIREGVSRFPFELPHTPGIELVGEITEKGSAVGDEWRVGDRVMPYLLATCGSCRYCRTGRESLCLTPVFAGGGYAEYTAVLARQLVRLPEGLDDVDAAATQIAFATAWHMMFTRGKLQAGETVMINSVGSGVGSAAVQLAEYAGAFVIGNASTEEKLDRAKGLGMHEGIDYTKEDVPERVRELTGGMGADMVIEYVGGDSFQFGLDSLAKDGRMVTCGAHAREVVDFDVIPFFRQQHTVIGSFVFNRDEVEKVLDLAGRGLIRPAVHKTFPLDEAREAMETMESRAHFGKLVLVP
ncbi:zinc-binding dehydrogenase [Rubrobacter marinus]|uniref:zinc-binding dehydrogenase n=1 Tax=Rubrobacter marinus TaxID=2653852 RepID=UPI00140D238F|nr:zinc-binding dehydrogenase [Rubrobacter marinus]